MVAVENAAQKNVSEPRPSAVTSSKSDPNMFACHGWKRVMTRRSTTVEKSTSAHLFDPGTLDGLQQHLVGQSFVTCMHLVVVI